MEKEFAIKKGGNGMSVKKFPEVCRFCRYGRVVDYGEDGLKMVCGYTPDKKTVKPDDWCGQFSLDGDIICEEVLDDVYRKGRKIIYSFMEPDLKKHIIPSNYMQIAKSITIEIASPIADRKMQSGCYAYTLKVKIIWLGKLWKECRVKTWSELWHCVNEAKTKL